jgi:predicted N-acyltransferase
VHLNCDADAFVIRRFSDLAAIDAAAWDGLVPRDLPHLRYGFLKAMAESGLECQPYYVTVFKEARLVAVTAAYLTRIDLGTFVPRLLAGAVRLLRRLSPKAFMLPMVNCGPVATGCSDCFACAGDLSDQQRQTVLEAMVRQIEAIPGAAIVSFGELPEKAASRLRQPLKAAGYLETPSMPGTRLDVTWESLDDYVGQVRKAFRRSVLKDLKKAESIRFELVDDFAEVAEEAWQLYSQVEQRADQVDIRLTPAFFKAVAAFDQSRLLTARDAATGRLIGIELLAFGETVLQDLRIGFDYALNPALNLYFNLMYPIIGYAGEAGFREIEMGRTAYSFKSRLGARPYPLSVFLKARNRLFHGLIRTFQGFLFPRTQVPEVRVFREPRRVAKPRSDAAESIADSPHGSPRS